MKMVGEDRMLVLCIEDSSLVDRMNDKEGIGDHRDMNTVDESNSE